MENLGMRIKSQMIRKGLTQKDLVDKCNKYIEEHVDEYDFQFDKSLLSQYVNGKSVPKGKRLIVLAETLGVSTDYLVRGIVNDTVQPLIAEGCKDTKTLGYTLSILTKLNKAHFSIVADLINQFYEEEQQGNNR